MPARTGRPVWTVFFRFFKTYRHGLRVSRKKFDGTPRHGVGLMKDDGNLRRVCREDGRKRRIASHSQQHVRFRPAHLAAAAEKRPEIRERVAEGELSRSRRKNIPLPVPHDARFDVASGIPDRHLMPSGEKFFSHGQSGERMTPGAAACHHDFHYQSLSLGGRRNLRIRAFFSASCSSLRSCAFFKMACVSLSSESSPDASFSSFPSAS